MTLCFSEKNKRKKYLLSPAVMVLLFMRAAVYSLTHFCPDGYIQRLLEECRAAPGSDHHLFDFVCVSRPHAGFSRSFPADPKQSILSLSRNRMNVVLALEVHGSAALMVKVAVFTESFFSLFNLFIKHYVLCVNSLLQVHVKGPIT